MSQRRVVLVAFEGAQTLDFTGPLEVFSTAERLHPGRYLIEVVAPGGLPFRTSSGLKVAPDRSTAACRGAVAPSWPPAAQACARRRATRLLSGGCAPPPGARGEWPLYARGRFCWAPRACSRAGGRPLHWAWADRFARDHPGVEVEPDRIFVRDGEVWTSAGVTAGIDLALALVEDDHGREAALEVARWLVVFVRRPGGQSQFSAPLAAQSAERGPLREVQEAVLAGPAGDLSVERLAERACMSPRNFARVFRRETGVTPAAWVETARVECARQLLEASSAPTETIAFECGFGTVETMRRAFRRRVGVSPGEYRDRFNAAVHDAA